MEQKSFILKKPLKKLNKNSNILSTEDSYIDVPKIVQKMKSFST